MYVVIVLVLLIEIGYEEVNCIFNYKKHEEKEVILHSRVIIIIYSRFSDGDGDSFYVQHENKKTKKKTKMETPKFIDERTILSTQFF